MLNQFLRQCKQSILKVLTHLSFPRLPHVARSQELNVSGVVVRLYLVIEPSEYAQPKLRQRAPPIGGSGYPFIQDFDSRI